ASTAWSPTIHAFSGDYTSGGMRKAGLALLFVLGLLAAGGLSAGVVAATTTTTGPTATTTAAPQVIPDGVTISGVDVGGLSSADAYTAVSDSFARPVVLLAPH